MMSANFLKSEFSDPTDNKVVRCAGIWHAVFEQEITSFNVNQDLLIKGYLSMKFKEGRGNTFTLDFFIEAPILNYVFKDVKLILDGWPVCDLLSEGTSIIQNDFPKEGRCLLVASFNVSEEYVEHLYNAEGVSVAIINGISYKLSQKCSITEFEYVFRR